MSVVQPFPASPGRPLAPPSTDTPVLSGPVGVPRPGLPLSTTAVGPGSPYILIVDDDREQSAYLMLVIGEAGYPVQTVNDGRAALAACRRDPPALVISDVEMPEMDGLSLLRELRADPELAALPVLLSSASINEGIRTAALAAGANDYLDKPVADGVLLARIAGALGLAALRQDRPPLQWQCRQSL